MDQKPRPHGSAPHASGSKSKQKSAQDGLVISPAGPVRKENVHPVGPNEEVRGERDGTLKVVPKPARNSGDK